MKEYFQNASSILKIPQLPVSYEKLLPPVNEIDKSRSFIYLDLLITQTQKILVLLITVEKDLKK